MGLREDAIRIASALPRGDKTRQEILGAVRDASRPSIPRPPRSVPAGKFALSLSAVPNPDFSPGSWEREVNLPVTWAFVRDSDEASKVARRFIHENNLGGGNWSGGYVFDGAGQQVARVSYNGRVWGPGRWPTPEVTFGKTAQGRVARGISVDALDSLVMAEALNLGLPYPESAYATQNVIQASDKLRRGMGKALAAWEQHHPLQGGIAALTQAGGMGFALEALVGPGHGTANMAAWKKYTSRPQKLINFLLAALERERREFDAALTEAAVETAE